MLQTEVEIGLSVGACNSGSQCTVNLWDNQGYEDEWTLRGQRLSSVVRLGSFLNSKLTCWLKKNRLCFMHVLLNPQGSHSRSSFLLVIFLVYWYNLSARLWLLSCSPSYRLHTSISQTSTTTSLCASERRVQQQEKWLSS